MRLRLSFLGFTFELSTPEPRQMDAADIASAVWSVMSAEPVGDWVEGDGQ